MKKNNKKKDSEYDLVERKRRVMVGLEEILNDKNLDLDVRINFPDYRNIPDDLKLALIVLSKHRYDFVLDFKERV